MNIPADIIKKEKLSAKRVAELEEMLNELSDGHMVPEVYFDMAVNVDTTSGGQTIPADLFSADQIKTLKKFDRSSPKSQEKCLAIVRDYLEHPGAREIEEIDVREGWMAHLTAPGYMDQTELSLYGSFEKAVEDLYRMYGE